MSALAKKFTPHNDVLAPQQKTPFRLSRTDEGIIRGTTLIPAKY